MSKPLSEMSLEELWELFPIILKPHNPKYKAWYETERQGILRQVPTGGIARISHIGSTSVNGLVAKPTVDILLEIVDGCDYSLLTDNLNASGWSLMLEEDKPFKLEFCKGYTPEGFAEKVFHLHVRFADDWDELYFRDYLAVHPEVAAAYGELKQRLLKPYKHDRDGYTNAKSDFIIKHSAAARREFPGRYSPHI